MPDTTPKKRREIDPVFKQILTDYLTPLSASVETQVEVSRLPRTIDAIVTVSDEQALHNMQTQTPFPHFRHYNQVEFKGSNDSLDVWDYFTVRGRTNLYLANYNVFPQMVTVTFVCASKPKTVLEHEHIPYGFVKQQEAGYYYCIDIPAIYMIVVNELPLLPKNYPLLLFASSKRKFRQFLTQLVAERNYVYLTYAYYAQPKMTEEFIDMSQRYGTDDDFFNFFIQRIQPQLWQFMANHPESLEPLYDKLFPLMLAMSDPAERLAGLDPAERLAGLDPAERKKLLDLLLQEQAAEQANQVIPEETATKQAEN